MTALISLCDGFCHFTQCSWAEAPGDRAKPHARSCGAGTERHSKSFETEPRRRDDALRSNWLDNGEPPKMSPDDLKSAELRAYEIWDREGRPDGQHESHWYRALAELGLVPPYDESREAIPGNTRRWDEAEHLT